MRMYRIKLHKKGFRNYSTDEIDIQAKNKNGAIKKCKQVYKKHHYGPIVIDSVVDITEAWNRSLTRW